jgi:hypothetical protein
VLGQDAGEVEAAEAGAAGGDDAPVWIANRPRHEFDADAMLARGETPVGRISSALAGMAAGEALVVRSTFEVAPLIDAMKARGHEVFSRKVGDDAWEAWVRRGE